jgi:hypothetical protein
MAKTSADAATTRAAHRPIPRALGTLRRLCLALPGVWEKTSHGEPTFWNAKKMFATFAHAATHHGNGRHAVWCKSDHLTQKILIAQSPERYFSPPYVGVSGWIGIHLDGNIDWNAVAARLEHGHRLAAAAVSRRAPKR